MDETPPMLAIKLLRWFLKKGLLEEVEGDLEEQYLSQLEKKNKARARINYWYQVIQYIRPFAIKPVNNSNSTTMNQHNLLISYRILVKNKVFSIINIGGLALGLTVAMMVGLWIKDELSFNQYHQRYNDVVQVLRYDLKNNFVGGSQVSKLGEYLRANYSNHFETVAITFFRNYEELLTKGKNTISEKGYFFEEGYGEILDLTMLKGSYVDHKPDEIVIAQSVADKFYREKNPIGERITFNGQVELTIKGVFEDLPHNSTFQDAKLIVSMDLVYNEENPRSWGNFNSRVFGILKPNEDPKAISESIKKVLQQNSQYGKNQELLLHTMPDWHLKSDFKNGIAGTGQKLQVIRMYGLIGLFVLILACINFMNLNTARYQHRGKEVGIRKTLGSLRKQLITQFLMESGLYVFAAFIIALVFTWLLLPWFGTISDKDLSIPIQEWSFWAWSLGFVIGTGILAGSYPSLLLSSFHPLSALKGTLKQGVASTRMRQFLVVFQFTVSLILIIGTVVVHNQIYHVKDRPIGYDQEGIITIRGRTEIYFEKYRTLVSELKNKGLILESATATYPLTNTLGNNDVFYLEDRDLSTSFNTVFVTDDYGKTTNWELVAGRDFSPEIKDERGFIIISELAAEMMQLEDPIGEVIYSKADFMGKTSFTIIGVIKDMIKGSPYGTPVPLIIFNTGRIMPWAFFKLNPNIPWATAIPRIQDTFEQILAGHPFMYSFLEQEYAEKFREEERLGNLATFFSILAIIVSCLGLFGLSAFVVENRRKEIGIRKTLGATVVGVWKMITSDFAILVLIAFTLAAPTAYFFMNNWLETYDYRVTLSWWIFAFGFFLVILITLATVSYHSLKASFENPVGSLRSE